MKKATDNAEKNGNVWVALDDGRGRNKETKGTENAGMNILKGQKIMFSVKPRKHVIH